MERGETMKNFIKEFKEFAVKGNMIDMAVGVIIGAAFKALIVPCRKNLLRFFLPRKNYNVSRSRRVT